MSHFTTYLGNKKRNSDEKFMRMALEAAEAAKSQGNPARGAVLVFPSGTIVEEDTTFTDHNPLATAEINALKTAFKISKTFKEAVLYATTEPSILSVCAAYEFGVREVVFGAFDDVNGFVNSKRLNLDITHLGGILSEECYAVAGMTLRESLRVK